MTNALSISSTMRLPSHTQRLESAFATLPIMYKASLAKEHPNTFVLTQIFHMVEEHLNEALSPSLRMAVESRCKSGQLLIVVSSSYVSFYFSGIDSKVQLNPEENRRLRSIEAVPDALTIVAFTAQLDNEVAKSRSRCNCFTAQGTMIIKA